MAKTHDGLLENCSAQPHRGTLTYGNALKSWMLKCSKSARSRTSRGSRRYLRQPHVSSMNCGSAAPMLFQSLQLLSRHYIGMSRTAIEK